MADDMKKITIGILAHVDAGKTTLSESLLYQTGSIRKIGRVDHGDAFLDSHEIERERGITIFSSQAEFFFGNTEVTLVDTPGHADFSSETERTLQILDYAVLVVSGTDGIQSHTETLWQLLMRYQIPCFIFFNKMDVSHRSKAELIKEIQTNFSPSCIDFSDLKPIEIREELALCDDILMERFSEQSVFSDEEIQGAVYRRTVFPCFFGSALKSEGIEQFLKGLDRFTAQTEYGTEFGAKVFKITRDSQGERLTHLKITGGKLTVKMLLNAGSQAEKVNQIRQYNGTKFELKNEADAGTVCTVTGLSKTYPGEGLGAEQDSNEGILEPILNYRVILPETEDVHTVFPLLKQLEEEDPYLKVEKDEMLQEIHVRIMGEVQLEVLKRFIFQRFHMRLEFAYSNIAYKETICNKTIGVGHYEPLRHYAEVHLLLEPGKRGSGLVFESKCREEVLERNYQRLILTHLQEKQHLGALGGFPITDLKLTLVAGKAHQKHTVGGDFRQAAYRAVRQGLRKATGQILEPWYRIKLEVPADCIGRAMTDIQQMGGICNPPDSRENTSVLTGEVPAAELGNYQQTFIGYTGGKGRMTFQFCGYQPCHNEEEVLRKRNYQPDSDTENTADSVFCSHGSGFVVSWDQVQNYQHIDSGIRLDSKEIQLKKAESYQKLLATDEELMKIFEKTYGPVKRHSFHALKSVKTPPSSAKQKPYSGLKKSGKEYLLIDGYNIIYAWDDLRHLAEKNMDLARETLLRRICNYRGFHQCEIILIFDAYRVEGGLRSSDCVCGVHLVYTKEAETADMYIEKVTHELGRDHKVRVATSDRLEQLIIIGNGAVRIPAESFLEEVEETERQIQEFLL